MENANPAASGTPGSAATDPVSTPTAGQSGTNGQVDYEAAYKELETKMGSMGQEVGEFRTFFQNISPLLEKLDQNPELVQAIIDGKIDKTLAQAVFEGRVDIKDATVVSQASQQVQDALGNKVTAMDPKEIEKLVEAKAQDIRRELAESAEMKSFEEKTQKFIEATPDFTEYAEDIDKWLDAHDVTDIEVAYWAVKGQKSQAQARTAQEEAAAEEAKRYALNASGGGVNATTAPDGTPLIDKLVGGPANPIF